MPQALDWLTTAEQCFADDYGSLRQGLLTVAVIFLTQVPRNSGLAVRRKLKTGAADTLTF
jgi:hypothetical protein